MRTLLKRVISLLGVYSIGNISQNALSILLIPLYTKYLTTGDFGILALMETTVNLLAIVVTSPVNNAIVRFYYKPDYIKKNGVLLFSLFFIMVIKAIVLATAFFYFSDYISSLFFEDQKLSYIVKVYSIILFVFPISAYLLTFIRLREMAKYYVSINISRFILSFLIIIYLLIKLKLGILAVIYGNLFSLCYTVILGIPILIKHSDFKLSIPFLKDSLKFGYPLIVKGYSNVFIQSGDRYILRIFESLSVVGLYSFGYKIAGILNIVFVDPIKQTLLPIFYKKESNPTEQKNIIMTIANYYYFVGIFAALGLSLFAKELIMILARSKEFWPSWKIVPFIAFSYVHQGLGDIVNLGLIMENKKYHISAIAMIAAIVNLTLNIILIPIIGIIGAATATVASFLVWNIFRIFYSEKFYDIKFDIKKLLHITTIGLGLYLLSLFFTFGSNILLNIILKAFILLLYPILFFITKFFTEQEKIYMKKIIYKIKTSGIKSLYNSLYND